MVQSTDENLDAALAAPERVPVHATRLGGTELGEQVQSWKVERAYNTDLPEAVRAVSGSSSAQLELQLGGAGGEHAPRLYSAWADRSTGDAVRPGQSVVHAAGVAGRTLPAFRGTVRSRSAASGSDTVTVQALDGAERLRGPASLPRPYHGFYYGRPVATATWCVDELLRQGGIHTCPPPRAPLADTEDLAPFTVLYASLHGGFNATYGQPEVLPSSSSYRWIRDGAPFEMALMPEQPGLRASWMPRSRFALPGKVFQVEAWVNTALAKGSTVEMKTVFDRSGGAAGYLSAKFDISTGTVQIASGTVDGGYWYFTWTFSKLAALRGSWHLGFMVDTRSNGTTVLPVVQPRLTAPDGSYHVGGMGTYVESVAAHPRSELQQIDLVTDMAVECLQVTDRVWADTATYPREEWEQKDLWRKGAELDEAALPLFDIPAVSGSQWDAITEIARASMSTAEFDEQGVFRWRGPSRFSRMPAAPDATVTTVRDISALTVSEEIDACRNHCEQPYQDWTGITLLHGEPQVDTRIRELKPGIPQEVSYAIADDESDIGPLVIVDDTPASTAGHRVRFGSAATGGTAVKGQVTVSSRREGPAYIVRFTNTGTTSVWTVTKDGKPSVQIYPLKRSADPKQRVWARWSPASQEFYGKQQYLAPASDWVQSASEAYTLAQTMLDAGRYPVPVLGEVEVLHDPRLQLGDVVRVMDTAGAKLDTLAWIVGMRTTCAAGAAPQQVLVLRGTGYNGVPADAGLMPDAPLDPGYGRLRTYQMVTAQYGQFADLTAEQLTYRTLVETLGGVA
ncbi:MULTISPECIES: hypothetical protein [Streptomyces]|uniref:hypothetical protein n=1 Tax=Streptomyces TaxID=1883 RepID=UPI000BFDC2E0|nr:MULTISPECIES: hypothetical protein [Streptomyces]